MNMRDQHLRALARAQYFMQSGITGSMHPRHRQQVEADIRLLSEVHSFVRRSINEPGLPLQTGLESLPTEDDYNGPIDT